MQPSQLSPSDRRRPKRLQAGIISRIRLENFMCHSNLEIEFGDMVNFITGQNGSGKSAILTALCVAFGCRARGTQRANTLKDFVKTGCSYSLVQVDIKNQGEDAFKHELYGDIIIVERRISESTGTTTITTKNILGKKIGTKKEDIREIVEHFNIDVENPCTIMSQDKSREFLHSGSGKDKFKATLLQQVDDLLNGIAKQLKDAKGLVSHLEESLRPTMKELNELQEKIKNMEHMEEISQQVQLLRKKLAWSWVYDADRKLDAQHKLIERLKGRIPKCQAWIDQKHHELEELNDQIAKKKKEISNMMERTSEVRQMKEDLKQSLSLATKEKLELESEQNRGKRQIASMEQQVKSLQRQIQELHDQHVRNTQAEENEMAEKIRELQVEIDAAFVNIQRSKEEEDDMSQRIAMVESEIENFSNQIAEVERSHHDISSRIREIQMHQRNRVTAFGGRQIINLLKAIERHQHKFSFPPIGPIGAHVNLEHGDRWAVAIETAVGRLLNAFIVTDHKDSRILRTCAREANYNHLQIIIHDFRRPRINIPGHMLPQTNHPTALSVLHSDNPTVLNVLVDMGNVERQVLVKDYDVGKTVAFDQRIPNLKEVYTSDGCKMFYRSSAQTILPPNRNIRAGRLSGSFDNQITDLERDASETKSKAQQDRGLKRAKEEELIDLRNKFTSVKRRRINMERHIRSKEFELEDVKKSLSSEANGVPTSTLDDLHQDISKLHDEIQEKEALLAKLQNRVNEAGTKAEDFKMSFENLCVSAKSEIDALAEAEKELITIEKNLNGVEGDKQHYEEIMHTKVLLDLKNAEAEYRELEHSCQENRRKASTISPESEIEALGGCEESNPEILSNQLTKLSERLKRESQKFPESIEDLRMLFEEKERKISRKLQTYKAFREKLEACDKALNSRCEKFQRNATLLKRQLTWQFNGHLKKKGFSGQIKVSYEEQTLSVEVKMPQDASSSTVRDTSGLSGGERSFSTLCFALALHEMTEAPFRAMDEFDVFMDAVSRKISLDALVDFALAQGSQWIFITPHDISMVKHDERIKKQQMAAPRG